MLQRFLFPLICLLICNSLVANDGGKTLSLSSDMSGIDLTSYLYILEDPTKEMTLSDVMASSSEFKKLPSGGAVLGVSTSAWWVRLDIHNSTNAPISWILEMAFPHTDFLDLYRVSDDGEVTHIQTGDKRPFSQRPIAALDEPAFPLTVVGQHHEKLLLRLAYDKAGVINLLMNGWSPTSYLQHEQLTSLFSGAILGAAVMVVLFNIIVRLSSSNAAFYWYVLYLLSGMMSFIANSGLGYRYIWRDSPILTDSLHILTGGLVMFFAAQFGRVFLQTATLAPHADKLLKGIMLCALLVDVMYLMGWRAACVQLLLFVSLSMIVMPFIGLWVWYKYKKLVIRWFVVAWGVWTIALLVTLARLYGLFSVNETFFQIAKLGFFGETILLGVALIDQVNRLKQEKRQAEAQLLKTMTHDNILLEDKVRQRTQSLNQAKLEAEILANTDVLTGIGNRRYFFLQGQQALERACQSSTSFTLGIIDIDHFKQINDSHGHLMGDQVICHLAHSIQAFLTEDSIVGRIGGDEFAFIVPGQEVDRVFEQCADLLQKKTAFHMVASHETVRYSVCIGLTALSNFHQTLDDLLRQADVALYESKENGRHRVEIYLGENDQVC